MRLKTALLYARTLRYLKPVQIYARIQKKLIKPKFTPTGDLALREAVAEWQSVIQKAPSMLGATHFRFLNEEHDLDETGWDHPELAKLWRYNLHYFDDLTAQDADDSNKSRTNWHEALITRWIAENPPANGTGWEPYPVSLRIVNWIKWLLRGNAPPENMIQSLGDQAGWLAQNLEHHILGNHLFANAKALIFLGSFFESPEAQSWLKTGRALLEQELHEQILADGGHFELSPMYHAIILEDILDLIQIGRCFQTISPALLERMEEAAKAMLHWLKAMSHPDGKISFFNDSAFGIAAENTQISEYAKTLRLDNAAISSSLEVLKDSGYIRTQVGEWTTLLDVAKIGPDYLPGHAHADTLSFELSHGAQRIFVNSGTSEYGLSAERLRQRGTAAHNSIEIDGKNSSEVWSGFRVARRAKPFDLDIQNTPEGHIVTCAHDGYKRLSGRPVHKRSWSITPEEVVITDYMTAGYDRALSHMHFHPDVDVTLDQDGQSGTIQYANQLLKFEIEEGVAQLHASTYHPEFGTTTASQKLVICPYSSRLTFTMRSR